MSINAYYRDELNYLRETADIFAKANPQLSRFLGKSASDPDVERLMEGFAFLVGRLRQHLDAEMPQMTHGLLKLVWPHCLRPIAPITTVQFRIPAGTSESHITVPRGTSVQTESVGGETIEFRTSFDLKVLPLEIAAVDFENRAHSCLLSLAINRTSGHGLHLLDVSPIQLFVNGHGDTQLARKIYLFLLEKVTKVQVTPTGGTPQTIPVRIEPLGFDQDQATLPQLDGTFGGFRIMQEYFSCPEKFMYLRISGLEAVTAAQTAGFTLSFEMNQRFPDAARFTSDQFALNATPAINLVEAEGEALMISHDRREYHVRARGTAPARTVHAVQSATGWVQGSGQQIDYQPFESFEQAAWQDNEIRHFYHTQVRPAVIGNGVDHYISFVPRVDGPSLPETETVSLQLLCSDGERATKLRIGSVNSPTSSTPAKLQITNITPILSEVPPPLDDRILWTFIASLARNFASLVDVDALRTVVGAYDFRANIDRQAAQQRDLYLKSFQRFERKGIDIISNGRPVRAYGLTLSVAEDLMGGEGEMYFFGSILDKFLKSYAGINSMHQFTIRGVDSNISYRWSAKWGEAPSL